VLAAALTFGVGITITWLAYDLSGCSPDPFPELQSCNGGWESEASWLVAAVGYVLAFVVAPVLLLIFPLRRLFRDRQRAIAGPYPSVGAGGSGSLGG
jgi:hypothetical protein